MFQKPAPGGTATGKTAAEPRLVGVKVEPDKRPSTNIIESDNTKDEQDGQGACSTEVIAESKKTKSQKKREKEKRRNAQKNPASNEEGDS